MGVIFEIGAQFLAVVPETTVFHMTPICTCGPERVKQILYLREIKHMHNSSPKVRKTCRIQFSYVWPIGFR